ncbi:hypothetical protein BCAR13_150002 [Paraburkholderia caribensis]|nr:hypothetical protein BCAR13_150002 [Paraburkholderia caribensis]
MSAEHFNRSNSSKKGAAISHANVGRIVRSRPVQGTVVTSRFNESNERRQSQAGGQWRRQAFPRRVALARAVPAAPALAR